MSEEIENEWSHDPLIEDPDWMCTSCFCELCTECKTEYLDKTIKPEPTIPVSELREWIENNQVTSDSKSGDYILVDDLLTKFCGGK